MKLTDLEKYNDIVIQLHDNPDADAVGSGYAIYRYFLSKGKNVRLIYGGRMKMTKSNMKLMVQELKIPIEYAKAIDKPELLLTVDCQYGEGNVTHFDAENVAMIDHHNTGRMSDEMAEIRSHIVSCATVCYDMLRDAGYNVNEDIKVSTALYYGLFMDSNELSEIRHPLERDMVDFLKIDKKLIKRLNHANFSIEELETAAIAMLRFSYDEVKKLSIIKSKPCDPNILGLVGDMVLQVDSIDVCIIFNECSGGYKLSVRSCDTEVAANELASFLTEGIGNGGGHIDKAGGFINEKVYREKFDDMVIESYIFNRVEEYYDSYDVIYPLNEAVDITGFETYKKAAYTCGYIKSTDIFEPGTDCKIRTYEGDVFINADENVYLMIGYFGELYPIEAVDFASRYIALDEPFTKEFEYAPVVMNMELERNFSLMPYAKKCISNSNVRIYAKELKKALKIFTKWDYETYMYGVAGDFLCYAEGDENDVYIVKREVFEYTYVKET